MLFSEEAETCKDCLAEEFTLNEWSLITNPGKFEGEPLATYHAWHYMMDGADDETTSGDYPVSRVGNVLIEESESGFVYGTVCDTDEEAIRRFAEIEDEIEEEEDDGNDHFSASQATFVTGCA